MKAMVLTAPGRPLELQQVPVPEVGPNGVLVRVRACGVGLTIVKDLGTGARWPLFPRIIGHELAGDLAKVGSEVRTVEVGQRVTCHFYLTCGTCEHCRDGRETLCLRPGGQIGKAINGGYAQYTLLPERCIIPIPDEVSYIDAAIGADAIATPLHACREARIRPGDDVLVIGAGGGVGVHMVQVARLYGGRVLALDVGDEKLELARSVGADEVIDGRRGDFAEQAMTLTDGRGVDAVIDMVASTETLGTSLRAFAVGGRWVLIGSRPKEVYGEDPRLAMNPMDFQRRALELHTSRYVNAAEIRRTLRLLRRGRVKAIVTRTFPLESADLAHELIRRNASAGRLALIVD
jgi:D-arabinose 1-dehydrogenase-like Zn-dependent alcohol dehydrogenase